MLICQSQSTALMMLFLLVGMERPLVKNLYRTKQWRPLDLGRERLRVRGLTENRFRVLSKKNTPECFSTFFFFFNPE